MLTVGSIRCSRLDPSRCSLTLQTDQHGTAAALGISTEQARKYLCALAASPWGKKRSSEPIPAEEQEKLLASI